MPKVSVVIPLYNKGPHIARTLNSILRQTYQDFEIIIVDGNSTDDGPEIIRKYSDSRIKLVQQCGKGVSDARNQGVEIAKADLIAFLDADDEWMPSHLKTILHLREKYASAGMYTTAYKIQMSNGKTRWAKYMYIPKPPWEGLLPNYFKSFASKGEYPVWTSLAVIPKKIFLEAGGFPQGYWYGEDADLFGKIALKYPVAFSWELGGIYHTDATNRISNKKRPADYKEPFVVFARNALDRGEILPEFIEPLNEYISKREINRAKGYILAGNSKMALDILKNCETRWFYKMKLQWIILAKIPHSLLLFMQGLNRKMIRFTDIIKEKLDSRDI